MRPVKRLKEHFHGAMKVETTAESIALGFSLGTFIGILPTPGFGILIGLLVALIFKKVSKVSMILAFLIWNPFLLFPIYLLSFKIGNLLFGDLSIIEIELSFFQQIYHFSRRFLVGNLIIAFSASFLSYFIVKRLVKLYRKKNPIEGS